MRPFNDVTVASDNLLGGLQNVTKHVLHGMVLGEITDGLRALVSESVLVGLARELDISVEREPPSCSVASPTDVQWSVKT